MTSPENGSAYPVAPENGNGEPSINLQAQTTAQRLREGIMGMLRNLRGTALRLSTYLIGSTIEYTALKMNGVDESAAVLISFGTLVPAMVAGEAFLWNKVSQRLPWFRVSYTDPAYFRNRRS